MTPSTGLRMPAAYCSNVNGPAMRLYCAPLPCNNGCVNDASKFVFQALGNACVCPVPDGMLLPSYVVLLRIAHCVPSAVILVMPDVNVPRSCCSTVGRNAATAEVWSTF